MTVDGSGLGEWLPPRQKPVGIDWDKVDARLDAMSQEEYDALDSLDEAPACKQKKEESQ